MKILITGAGGFIGSHLTELMLSKGYNVRALVRYNCRGSWGHLEEIPEEFRENLEVRLGDITDAFFVRDLVTDCNIVLHLSALIGIPYSYIAPASYIQTNVSGTLNVLEACREAKTPRLVITSTSEVYGTAIYTPIDENHPLQGQSPYSASKIGADKLAESYFRSFDLPVVTLRPFNTYGPRQSTRAVIPTILSQGLNDRSDIRLGNLEAKRDLTYVSDTVRAFYLAATTPGIEGETIHFGQGSAVTVHQLAQNCLDLVGSRGIITSVNERMRPDKSEVGVLICNAAKAHSLLGWHPEITLKQGLRYTADYFRNNIKRSQSIGYIV